MNISLKTLVVVSFYDRHPPENIRFLLKSLKLYKPGADYDLCIVVNQTSQATLEIDELESCQVIYRRNVGMNIGAWDHGWRANPGYSSYLLS